MRLQADEVAQVADRVPDNMFGTKELQDLVDTMVAAMREAPGVGLAAPQIGVSMQVYKSVDFTQFPLAQLVSQPDTLSLASQKVNYAAWKVNYAAQRYHISISECAIAPSECLRSHAHAVY